MTGIAIEESGVQQCRYAEALAEWRSSEQVENGTPSISPPYWDTDDDDDCGGLFVSSNLLHCVSLSFPLLHKTKGIVRRVIMVVFFLFLFVSFLRHNIDLLLGI